MTAMKMDEATTERIRAALAEVCRELPVRLVVLFGSQADGRARPDSDVDVAVQLADRRDWAALGSVGALLERLLQCELDVVPLNGAGPALLVNVAEDGVPLFEAAEGDWARFRATAYRVYEDAAPVRAEQDSYLMEKWGIAI